MNAGATARAPRRGRRALGVALPLAVLASAACSSLGPATVASGRPAYNAVINATEDEQILGIIVRHRYDETFGLLAVSGVTASLRFGVALGADVGIGPSRSYDGNLVPLGVEAAYEESPVISYVPLRGEQFVQRMLAPVTAEQALLLFRMSTEQVEVVRMLVRRVNGLVNPRFAPTSGAEDGGAFDRFVDLYARLRDRGTLDVVRTDDGEYRVLVHAAAEPSAEVAELWRTAGVAAPGDGGDAMAVPLRFFVGANRGDGLDLETPSALEVIAAAGAGVEVPESHREQGLARAARASPELALLRIHSSRERPSHALVAVTHRGWWFFVDARDARSKQAFLVLRTLIGLRLDEGGTARDSPVLTLPVGG